MISGLRDKSTQRDRPPVQKIYFWQSTWKRAHSNNFLIYVKNFSLWLKQFEKELVLSG